MSKENLVLAFLALSFYCLGGGLFEHFVLFDSWGFIGEQEFTLVHERSGWRDMAVYVTPLLFLFVVDILLLLHRPTFIPKSWLWAAVLCHVITWVSSAFIQIPLQLSLNEIKDMETLRILVGSDWIRLGALLIHSALALAILLKLKNLYATLKIN